MSSSRALRSFVLVFLLQALSGFLPKVHAWGPYTHAVINQEAVDALAAKAGFEFLAEDPYRSDFISGGTAPDMTFDISRGGKSAPEYNRVFHEPEFHAHLIEVARRRRRRREIAWALGFGGHLSGDAIGNGPDTVTAHNSFDFPEDEDIYGAAVSDPNQSAKAKLQSATTHCNKIMVDTILWGKSRSGATKRPEIARDLLYLALISYEGPHALPHQSDDEKQAIWQKLGHFRTRYGISFRALLQVARYFHNLTFLRGGFEGEMGGKGFEVPGFRESSRQVVFDAERVIRQGQGAGGSVLCNQGCFLGASVLADLEALQEALGSGPVRTADEEANPLEESSPRTSEEAEALASAEGADVEAQRQADLASLRKKVLLKFLKAGALPGRRWPTLRDKVRGLVPFDDRNLLEKLRDRGRDAGRILIRPLENLPLRNPIPQLPFGL